MNIELIMIPVIRMILQLNTVIQFIQNN